jgi:hypothetical protein
MGSVGDEISEAGLASNLAVGWCGMGGGRLLQLWGLGALDSESGEISGLGRRMARMPLDPPLARAMCAAEVRLCMRVAACVVSASWVGGGLATIDRGSCLRVRMGMGNNGGAVEGLAGHGMWAGDGDGRCHALRRGAASGVSRARLVPLLPLFLSPCR